VHPTKEITSDNFLIIATKAYENQLCSGIDEFNSDLRKFSAVRRLCKKLQKQKKSTDLRLLLNNIIILNNLFDTHAIPRLLLFYCKDSPFALSYIVTILSFLRILPNNVLEVNLKEVMRDIEIEQMLEAL